MEFWETSVFTKQITKLMPDDLYKELQGQLIDNPNKGDVIKSSGGLRKLRWKVEGSGKRGGVRIIYYNVIDDCILMLFAYRKNQAADLTVEQVAILKQLAAEFSPKE